MTESPTDPTADRPDYGLADVAASDAVHAVVTEVATQFGAGELSRLEAVVLLGDGMRQVGETYPDVLDGSTRTEVVRALDPVLERAGEQRLTPWEW